MLFPCTEAQCVGMCTLDPRTRDPSIIIHGEPCKKWNGAGGLLTVYSLSYRFFSKENHIFMSMFIFAQPIPCSV